jgi:hypothetical protein
VLAGLVFWFSEHKETQQMSANISAGWEPDGIFAYQSRGGQAVSVSSVSYGESTRNLSEMLKHADELILYHNTAHGRGFRVVAQFISGNLCKTAQTMPDWVAKALGKELAAVKQREKSEGVR